MIGPAYLNIPEKLMLLALIFYAMFVFIKYRKILLLHYSLILGVALAFLGGSVIYDNLWFEMPFGHWNFLIEDGMKWIGICAWCYFVIFRCVQYFHQALTAIYFSK